MFKYTRSRKHVAELMKASCSYTFMQTSKLLFNSSIKSNSSFGRHSAGWFNSGRQFTTMPDTLKRYSNVPTSVESAISECSTVPYYFEDDTVREIGTICRQHEMQGRCVVICSSSAHQADRVQKVLYFLRKGGHKPIMFPLPDQAPTTDSLQAAHNLVQRMGIEFIVAVGGGGVLETGKALALNAANDRPIWEYSPDMGGTQQPKHASLPILLLPTCPTAAEMRKNAYVIFKQETAFSVTPQDTSIQVALIDPELAETVGSRHRTIFADALLAQCLDTYIHTNASTNSQKAALIGMIYTLQTIYNDLLQCRDGMHNLAIASLCCSAAINASPGGLSRAIGLAAAGRYHVSYSTIVSCVWRSVLSKTIDCLEEQDSEQADISLQQLGHIRHVYEQIKNNSQSNERSFDELLENILSQFDKNQLHGDYRELQDSVQNVHEILSRDNLLPLLEDEDWSKADFERIATAAETEPNAHGHPGMSTSSDVPSDAVITRQDLIDLLEQS